MISLSVSRSGCGVGVGRQVMKFCGSIVRALWHGVPPVILDTVVGVSEVCATSNEFGDLVLC
jgi:hypothetical protein